MWLFVVFVEGRDSTGVTITLLTRLTAASRLILPSCQVNQGDITFRSEEFFFVFLLSTFVFFKKEKLKDISKSVTEDMNTWKPTFIYTDCKSPHLTTGGW